jgi:hypothetical protein
VADYITASEASAANARKHQNKNAVSKNFAAHDPSFQFTLLTLSVFLLISWTRRRDGKDHMTTSSMRMMGEEEDDCCRCHGCDQILFIASSAPAAVHCCDAAASRMMEDGETGERVSEHVCV